jgi:hypothetical protein
METNHLVQLQISYPIGVQWYMDFPKGQV